MKPALPWLLAAWLCAAAAHAAGDEAAERARIAAERLVVEQRHGAAEAACQTRFRVTECLDAARVERRQSLDSLQRQSDLLDDARRRERAARRMQAIQRRDAEAPPTRTAPAPALPAASVAPAPRPAAVPSTKPQRPAQRAPAASPVDTGARERQRQAQYQRRLEAARQHELAVQQRNARQEAKRKPAAGLPAPGASAAAP